MCFLNTAKILYKQKLRWCAERKENRRWYIEMAYAFEVLPQRGINVAFPRRSLLLQLFTVTFEAISCHKLSNEFSGIFLFRRFSLLPIPSAIRCGGLTLGCKPLTSLANKFVCMMNAIYVWTTSFSTRWTKTKVSITSGYWRGNYYANYKADTFGWAGVWL